MLIFARNRVQWRMGEKLATPTEEDVEKLLDTVYHTVYDREEETQAQIGGLLVKKQDGKVDLYIHLGELNE